MLEVIGQPGLEKYHRSYHAGEAIFLEGDNSQDLYILVSGCVTVSKGETALSEISEPGTLFGEMSFLLRQPRSATVHARTEVTAVRIAAEHIGDFLRDSPPVATRLSTVLAERLSATTTVLHGLKEFCNILPDAVVLTDETFRVLAWNRAAEALYGRSREEMQNCLLHDIYEDQAAYHHFLDQLAGLQAVREKPLKVRHPEDCWRFVATSTTILYDGHHVPRGYIFIGRDITASYRLAKKRNRLLLLLAPAAFLLGFLAAALLYRR